MTAFNHPFLSRLLGDEAVTELLSAEADIAAMVEFEIALAKATAMEDVISDRARDAIEAGLAGFEPDFAALNQSTERDGVVIPGLLSQLREKLDEEAAAALHFGATSQDVVDTSFSMRALKVLALLDKGLASVIDKLNHLDQRDGDKTVMAHTRMQAAMPVSVSRKIASWRDPLMRHSERLDRIKQQVGLLHFGGPVGTLDNLGDKGVVVSMHLASLLGLQPSNNVRHTERDGLADLANWLSLVTGSLGKTGADIVLFAQQEMDEIELSKGGGSSAMPHKVNPVAAETLVAMARFNAVLLSGLHLSLVHENERSGSAWTLEWMVLPQMMLAAGAAIRTADTLFETISFVGID